MGAYHSSELMSLFDLGGRPAELTPDQRRLSEQMIDYWTAFAATGDPADSGGPQWPEFEQDGNPPYAQELVPGAGGIGPIDLAAEHHCGFWG
jgi:para-nitrobenzyl esterase